MRGVHLYSVVVYVCPCVVVFLCVFHCKSQCCVWYDVCAFWVSTLYVCMCVCVCVCVRVFVCSS